MSVDIIAIADPTRKTDDHTSYKTFLWNTLRLGFGTGAGQLLMLASTPIIARMYRPDIVGEAQIVMSVAGTLAVVASLRLELALPLPKDDATAARLFRVIAALALASSLLIAFVVLVADSSLARWLGLRTATLLWALVPIVLLTSLTQVHSLWLTRTGRFGTLAAARFAGVGSLAAVQVALGLWRNAAASSLLIGVIAGGAVSLAIQMAERRQQLLALSASVRAVPLMTLLKGYKNFAIYSLPYSFLCQLSRTAVIVLLGVFGHKEAVGLYAFAFRVTCAPVSLVMAALNQVFYKSAAEDDPHRLTTLIAHTQELIVKLAVPVLAIVWAHDSLIISIAFGPRWSAATRYMDVLALMSFAYLLTSWLDRIYDARQRQRLALALEAGFDLISLGLFLLALAPPGQPLLAVMALTAVTVVYCAVWFVITIQIGRLDGARLANTLAPLIIMTIVGSGIATWIIRALLPLSAL